MKKKDPNYVVKVEQAIAKKYGEEAVQNPKADWDTEKEKKYLEQLKKLVKKERQVEIDTEKVDVGGFFINKNLIKKGNQIHNRTKTCEVCDKYSLNLKDDTCMTKWNTCFDCYIKWIENREERWKSGFRP